MKQLNITSGKWNYRTGGVFDQPSVVVMTDKGNLTIANCSTEHFRQAATILGETLPIGFTVNNDEANAKLMSKSPEMLELLHKCYKFIHEGANLYSLEERHKLESEIQVLYAEASGIEI